MSPELNKGMIVKISTIIPEYLVEYFGQTHPFAFVAWGEDLNATGVKWQENEKEKHCDVFLFFVEREEDNTYMKGGAKSQFGHVLGIKTEIFNRFFTSLRFEKAVVDAVNRAIDKIEYSIKEITDMASYNRKVQVPSAWYLIVMAEMVKRGLIIVDGSKSVRTQTHTIKSARPNLCALKVEMQFSQAYAEFWLKDIHFNTF
jgi:hypothetical protein